MCQTPADCLRRAEHWLQSTAWLERGQERLDRWNERGIPARISCHARQKRQLERAISFGDINVALANGQVIHRNIDQETKQEHLLVLAWLRSGSKSWRPIHVSVLLSVDASDVFIKTVYDPRSCDWMWTREYTRRVCWCRDHH